MENSLILTSFCALSISFAVMWVVHSSITFGLRAYRKRRMTVASSRCNGNVNENPLSSFDARIMVKIDVTSPSLQLACTRQLILFPFKIKYFFYNL